MARPYERKRNVQARRHALHIRQKRVHIIARCQELVENARVALHPLFPGARELGAKRRAIGIRAEAQNVQLLIIAVVHLHAGHHRQALPPSGGERLLHAVHAVMVGHGQQRDPRFARAAHELGRGQIAVGIIAVCMQVHSLPQHVLFHRFPPEFTRDGSLRPACIVVR